MASRIHRDFTKPVALPPFEKPGARYFECEGGWCWEARTLEGKPIRRGPFSTKAEAKEDCRKIVQTILESQRSGAGVVTDIPVSGDLVVPQEWKVAYVSEGIVWFEGRREFIPVDDLEFVSANTWRLKASVKATNL